MGKIHDVLLETVHLPVDAWTAGSVAEGLRQIAQGRSEQPAGRDVVNPTPNSEFQLSELRPDFTGPNFRQGALLFAPAASVAVAGLAASAATLVGCHDRTPHKINPRDDHPSNVDNQSTLANAQTLNLMQEGALSRWKQTYERVAVLLQNGYDDMSVRGYWPMDGNGDDVSRNGHHTIIDPEVTPTKGAFDDSNGALRFPISGSDHPSLSVASLNGFAQGTEAFAISVWVRHEPTGGEHKLFVYRSLPGNDSSPLRVAISLRPDTSPVGAEGQLLAQYCGPENSILSEVRVDDGKWHHVAFVRTAAPGSMVTWFIDGVLVASVSNDCGMATGPGALQWGGCGTVQSTCNPASEAWNGDLDEALLLSRALRQTEITAYYRSKNPSRKKVTQEATSISDGPKKYVPSANDGNQIIPSETESRQRGAADRVIDYGIDRVTPESTGTIREVQRDAVKFLLDPSTERSEDHLDNMIRGIRKVAEGEEEE